MNELLQRYVSVSISASLLLLILLLLQPLYKDRFAKQWQYYVWLIVILRFVIPWNPVNGLVGSLFYQIQERIQADELRMVFSSDHIYDNGIEPADGTEPADRTEPADGTDTAQMESYVQPPADRNEGYYEETIVEKMNGKHVSEIGYEAAAPTWYQKAQKEMPWVFENMWIVWLAPALLLLIRKVTIYQSFIRFFKAGSVPDDDIGHLEILGRVIEQNHVHCTVGLYTNSLTASAIMTGFFRPTIILTKENLSERDVYYTVLHEMIHYQRRDMFYKWLVQLTVCLHWFNPLIYVMERETNRLCELSCDEAVTKKMNMDEKRAYGDMLLRAMQAGGIYKNDVASVTLYGGKELLKERLGAMMNEKKKSRRTTVLAAVLTIALACGGIAAGACMYPAAAADTGSKAPLSYEKIIEKDGCFYLLCEGADERDMPSGSVTDGCIGIILVKKDRYISIGPFENVQKLVRDVNLLVHDMLKEENIEKAEADLFTEAAEKIRQDILKVSISKTSVSLAAGQTYPLKLYGTNSRAAWFSKNNKIAAVSKNGKVTAKKEGKAEIYAVLYGQTYSCMVQVSASAENRAAVKKGTEQDAYGLHGITKKNGAYFYRGRRIRIFMDLRADQSFVNFNYDEEGTVDIRLQRTEDTADISGASVRYLTKSEAAEILKDREDTSDSDDADMQTDKKQSDLKISRLRKEELPAEVRKTIRACKDRTWYVIAHDGVRYIYYNGLPDQYAFKPQLSGQKAEIKIVDMRSSGGNYVLLKIKKNVPLTIRYQNQKAALTRIDI